MNSILLWRINKYYAQWTHIEGYISLSSIDKSTCIASVTCHCSMKSTLSKKCAVHIVRSVAWNCSNHIGWICNTEKRRQWYSFHHCFFQYACVCVYKCNSTKFSHYKPIYLSVIANVFSLAKWSWKNKMLKVSGMKCKHLLGMIKLANGNAFTNFSLNSI